MDGRTDGRTKEIPNMYTFCREARVQPQVGRMVVRSDHVGDPLPRRQAIQRHAKGKLQDVQYSLPE